MMAAAAPVPSELLGVADAGGRVLRADLASLVDRPAADDSALDGFACRVEDTAGASESAPIELELRGEAPAGAPFSGRLTAGQAVKIATGGLLPLGADGVIGVEHAEARAGRVVVRRPAAADAVRPRGQDLRSGSTYLRSGMSLTSAAVGLAAAMGHGEVPVSRRPGVVIVTTGNEVIAPGRAAAGAAGPGQLYDANGAALAAAARKAGCQVLSVEYVPDDRAALREALGAHGRSDSPPDLIITTGGVSRGERDVVRDVLTAENEVTFWRVKVRPAGPTMFGRFGGLAVLGLPGNPVSALVGFLLFGRAFIDASLGAAYPLPFHDRLPVKLAGSFPAQNKTVLHRAHLATNAGVLEARPFDNQSSGVLRSLVEADALVITPPSGDDRRGDEQGLAIDLKKHL